MKPPIGIQTLKKTRLILRTVPSYGLSPVEVKPCTCTVVIEFWSCKRYVNSWYLYVNGKYIINIFIWRWQFMTLDVFDCLQIQFAVSVNSSVKTIWHPSQSLYPNRLGSRLTNDANACSDARFPAISGTEFHCPQVIGSVECYTYLQKSAMSVTIMKWEK